MAARYHIEVDEHLATRDDRSRWMTILQPIKPTHQHLSISDARILREQVRQLLARGYYLVTVVGTDERARVDKCFKILLMFSHPREDSFCFIEYPVRERLEVTTAPAGPMVAGILGGAQYLSLYASRYGL